MSASRVERLHQQLKAGMIENFEGKSFLPDSVLFQILHDTDLDACLRDAGVTLVSLPEKDRERIRKGGQKLFALLALLKTKCVELIVNFIKEDQLLDTSLDAFLPCKRIDDISDIIENNLLATEFFDTQWSLTAPLFCEDRSHRDFRKQTILPFIAKTMIGSGGYSQVYKVTFDPRHHCLGRGSGVSKDEVSIACKVMRLDSVDSTFENEKNVLQFLRQIRHHNMVQLLSSFSIELPKLGSVKYLLFPLADGSLQELLQRDARDARDVIRLLDTDENVFSELFGLASALENLHMYVNIADGTRLKGMHFDLAPRNILIYQGKLLLADFGLSRLRNESSNSYTPFQGGVGHYIAPECIDQDFAPLNKHGSKSDIWSFGGILAVIIAFMKGGKEAVRKFEQRRKLVREGTTYRFHDNGKEHPNLKQAMKDIAGVSSVEKTALDIASWILVVEPAQRPTAEMVSTELYILAQISRYHRIDGLFCNLSSKIAAIQLKIEQERFTIWCGCAGLAEHYDTRVTMRRDKGNQISWLVYSKEKYQVVADLLKEVQKEIEFLLTVVEVDSHVAPIFAHLRDLNDTLWGTAPLQDRKEMFRLLENAVERIYTLGQGGDLDLQQITSKNMPSWEKRAILIAMLKFRNNNPAAERNGKGLERSESSVKSKKIIGHLEIASIEGKSMPVICEWINYDIHTSDQVPDRLFNRVAAIAQQFSIHQLPAEFNVLYCEGYIHDLAHLRSGLLFSYPETVSADIEPVSLRFLLKKINRPSLGSLFDLAQTISQSLLNFHKADWLHKDISSHNVIFFNRKLSNLRVRPSHTSEVEEPVSLDGLPSPYLVGFNHSRPNDPGTFTSGGSDILKMYQHPEYANNVKQRFRLSYDYYSLGLLLLEIGLWEPISRSPLLGDKGIEKWKLWDLQKLWLEKAVPLLGPIMGTKYRDAVSFCLGHELMNHESQVRWVFEEKVVQQIFLCCA